MTPPHRAAPTPILVPPRDLTIPETGSTTARTIFSRAIARLLTEIVRLAPSPDASAETRATIETLRAHAAVLARTNLGALASALRRPTVSVLVRARREQADPRVRDTLACALAAQLAFELSLRGALDAPWTLAVLPAQLLSLGERVCVDVPPGARATFSNEGVVFHTAEGNRPLEMRASSDERAYHSVDRAIVLGLVDNNPSAMVEAHPDKDGNALDLGGRDAAAWTASLARSLACIERYLPELRDELDLFAQQLLPVGFDAERHLSASYQEAIGTVYLSLHPHEMTMTEALIHEGSHNKLNALFDLDDVLVNGFTPLYASPVRPDPRPLRGVLLAVHAFLPVARLYELMIAANDPLVNPAFIARFEAIKTINREGAEVLRNARPTVIGTALFEEIARWIDHFEAPRPAR